LCLSAPQISFAQCPQVLGSAGDISSSPVWFNCSNDLDVLTLETSSSWSNLVVDWGDGSPLQNVGSFDAGDLSVTHSYASGNTYYDVVLSEEDGSCSVEGVYYAAPPTGDFSSSENIVCQGTAVQFHQEATEPGLQYKWNFGVNPIFLTTATGHVSFTFQNAGVYEVQSVILYSGTEAACSDTSSTTIYVLERPDAEVILSTQEACGSAEVTAEAISSSGNQFIWSFGVAPYFNSGNSLPAVSFNNPGDYPISLVVTGFNGCQTSLQETVEIHPKPIANFDVDAVCIGETSNFFDSSEIASGADIIGWYWQFGDGQTSFLSNPSNDYAFAGNYEASLTVNTENCSSTITEVISANPLPTVSATADHVEGCSPLVVNLNATGTLNPDFTWDFGNGSTGNGAELTQTFETFIGDDPSNTISVTATSDSGCSASETITVVAHPQASSAFSLVDEAACAPFEPVISNESAGASAYEWFVDGASAGTQTQLSYTFENNSDFLQSSALELVATSSNGCSDTSSVTLNVFPETDFSFSLTTDSVCSPLEITMPAVYNASSFNWDFGNGQTSNESQPQFSLVNETSELLSSVVTFTGTSAFGCVETHQQTVHVKPQPVAEITLASASGGCAPFDASFTNNSSNGDAYTWNFGDGSPEVSGNGDVSHQFQTGSDAANYNVTLTATDDLGCSDTATEVVAVFPVADFELQFAMDSVCSPLVMAMPNIEGLENVTWDFGDGTTSNEATPTHTWDNNSNELLSALVSIEGQTADGCIGTASAMVHVKPQPVALFEISENSGCEPLNTIFSNESESADYYVWSFGDGQSIESATTSDFDWTYETNGEPVSFDITLIAVDDLGCSDTRTAEINVLPTPIYDLELEFSEACSPFEATLPEMENALTASWNFGDGTFSNELAPSHSWFNNSDILENHAIQFQGVNEFGCANQATTTISVKPQPTADFSQSLDAGCAPLNVIYTNESLRADFFNWEYGNGEASENSSAVDHDYTYTGESDLTTYLVTLTATHALGCSDVKMDSLTVFPEIFASWVGSVEGCDPFETTLEYDGAHANSIQWDLGNESLHTGALAAASYEGNAGQDTSYTVSLSVVSDLGCTAETNFDVIVHPVPTTGLSLSSTSACAETEVIISNESLFADSTVIDLGNGTMLYNSDLSSIPVTYANDGTSDLLVTLTQEVFTAFGCSAATIVTHTVHPKVTAAIETPESACTPALVQLGNTSINGNGSALWSFGDGNTSNALAPEHLFSSESIADTTYTVTLISQSIHGCSDSASAEVVVWGTPTTQLNLNQLEGCYPVVATFENASVGQTASSWAYGNGETSSTNDSLHSKVFFNPTQELIEYQTVLTTSNSRGCSSESMVTFEVAPHLNAAFSAVYAGCSPLDAQFINQSEGAETFSWDFNDGSMPSSEIQPEHVFVNNTNEDMLYEVKLIAESAYGCVDTVAVGVHVYPMPIAAFSVTPSSQTYPNTTVGINNMSLSSDAAVQYWSFGDGAELSGEQPIFHTYDTWGTYNITLLVDNGYCADALTEQIQILSPNPVADFVGSGSGCAPLLVSFDNLSNHGAGYIWDFGDDYMTSEESPVHVYSRPGVYNVSLTAIGYEGQENEVIQYASVEVFPPASAAFIFSPSEVVAPDQPVEFVNLSGPNATEFLWTFGDGMFSTEENPVYTYSEAGVYDVSLTANNAFNCPSTFIVEAAIEATNGGFMHFPTAFTPNNGGSTGGSYDPASLDNDVFHPHHLGIVEYELVVFNKWGELIFRSTDPYIGWDGYFQGRIVRQDVYAWRATAQFSNGHRVTKAGDVTLILQ
jgi:PKD repeat protein